MKIKNNLIKIGKIGKAHGLQGFFYFKHSYNLAEGDELFIENLESETKLKASLKKVKEHKNKTIIQLTELKDRTALEEHIGKNIFAYEKESSNPLDALINKKVCDMNGENFGNVLGFYNCGAGDIIIISNAKGENLELPFNSVYFNCEEQEKPLTLLSCHKAYEDFWQTA